MRIDGSSGDGYVQIGAQEGRKGRKRAVRQDVQAHCEAQEEVGHFLMRRKITINEEDKISFDKDVEGQIANLAQNPHGNLDVSGGFDEDPILLATRLISGLPPDEAVVAASEESMPRRRIQDMLSRRR